MGALWVITKAAFYAWYPSLVCKQWSCLWDTGDRTRERKRGQHSVRRNVNRILPTPFQAAAIFISLHVMAAARVTGRVRAWSVQLDPAHRVGLNMRASGGCFLSRLPQHRKRKTEKSGRKKKWREGFICNVCRVTWPESVRSLSASAGDFPAWTQTSPLSWSLSTTSSHLFPAPAPREFPEKQDYQQRQNQAGGSRVHFLLSSAF